jgi:hypothetical protein
VLTVRWQADDKSLVIFANLSDRAAPEPALSQNADVIWGEPGGRLAPWSVLAAVGGE